MSKGLQALERLEDNIICVNVDYEMRHVADYETIEKELKALEKYKSIEEKLGCPLDVLSTISENGFYYEYGYVSPCRIYRIDIFRKEILYYDEDKNCFSVKLSDYKKTWWLKEDKSE